MARDIHDEIDRLSDQLDRLRKTAARSASHSADDAVSYLAPIAKEVGRHIRRDGHEVIDAVRRHPGMTGAMVGVFALGAVACLVLSNSGRR